MGIFHIVKFFKIFNTILNPQTFFNFVNIFKSSNTNHRERASYLGRPTRASDSGCSRKKAANRRNLVIIKGEEAKHKRSHCLPSKKKKKRSHCSTSPSPPRRELRRLLPHPTSTQPAPTAAMSRRGDWVYENNGGWALSPPSTFRRPVPAPVSAHL